MGTAGDEQAAAIAAGQYGALSRAQALGAGLTENQIRLRVRRGRWLAPTRGAFVIAGSPETWERDLVVACLAGPPGTVASHLSAAALLGLVPPPLLPHVTVPKTANGGLTVATVHRSPVPAEDRYEVGPIPCTRPARTAADCAGLLSPADLCDLVDDLLCSRRTRVEDIRAAMTRAARGPGRQGSGQLNRALEVWTPGPVPGSPAEMRLIRRLVEWGLPVPEREVKIFDHHGRFVARVDVAWRPQKVGLEYDGLRYHGPRQAAADDARQQRVEALGWRLERADRRDLQPGSTRLRDLLMPLLAA